MTFKAFILLLLLQVYSARSENSECVHRLYDFASLAPGSSFFEGADGAWIVSVNPSTANQADCSAIFDSDFPPAADVSLGTPGECALGPGKGEGGQLGKMGANCNSLGNLLVCHGGDMNVLRSCPCVRYACEDCQPLSSRSGARFELQFRASVHFNNFTVVNLVGEGAMSVALPGGKTRLIEGRGNNSVQTVSVDFYFSVGESAVLTCSGTCALARLDMNVCSEPPPEVEISTMSDDARDESSSLPNPMSPSNQTIALTSSANGKGVAPTAIPIDYLNPTAVPIPIRSPFESPSQKSRKGSTTSEELTQAVASSIPDIKEDIVASALEIQPSSISIAADPFLESPGRSTLQDQMSPPISTPLSSPKYPGESVMCTANAPIFFNHIPVGAPVLGGTGYKMYTRRTGFGELQDVSAILDTGRPPLNDLDLGSPNSLCAGGGPGLGDGGKPGAPGENCVFLGHVLIAHAGNISELRSACEKCRTCAECAPDDASGGAEFVFHFTQPAKLQNIVILDVDEDPNSIVITLPSGKRTEYPGLGENGKVVVPLNGALVKRRSELKVLCRGSCAVVGVNRRLCSNTTVALHFPIPTLELPSPEAQVCESVVESFNGRRTGLPVRTGSHWKLETCRFETEGKQCDVSAAANSSDPHESDLDLGSPNKLCPGGGPGFGSGGEPRKRGENCNPLGQVVIAAEGDVRELRRTCLVDRCQPNDYAGAAYFQFNFTVPLTLNSMTMLDVDSSDVSAWINLHGDYEIEWKGLGDNSVSRIDFNKLAPGYVAFGKGESLTIICRSSCAVAEFEYSICQ